jgi:hypothetical protein
MAVGSDFDVFLSPAVVNVDQGLALSMVLATLTLESLVLLAELDFGVLSSQTLDLAMALATVAMDWLAPGLKLDLGVLLSEATEDVHP